MRIASNKVGDMISFYRSELENIYSSEELNALINICFAHYVHFSSADIITRKNDNLNQSDVLKLYDCCLALKKNIPLQYILKETVFYGLTFKVSPAVLIPRPETEELVELILKENKSADGNQSILDIGTGSGCIAISLKKNLSQSDVFAIDISKEALEVANENARLNKCAVIFNEANVLDQNASTILDSYDIIVSNPPYVAKKEADDMHSRVKEHEPHQALFVPDDDPLIFYKKIAELCEKHLNPEGRLYFEINPVYARQLKKAILEYKVFESAEIITDMSSNQRFLKATRL